MGETMRVSLLQECHRALLTMRVSLTGLLSHRSVGPVMDGLGPGGIRVMVLRRVSVQRPLAMEETRTTSYWPGVS